MDRDEKQFFEELYRSNRDLMLRYAYRLIGSVEKAEELVQEAFVLALLHEDELLRHPKPRSWLFVTLKYQLLNERRRKSSYSELPLESFAGLAAEAPGEPLEAALPRELSEEERRLLVWRFEQQLGYEEISARLGITQGACRLRVMRAVEKCRRALEKGGQI